MSKKNSILILCQKCNLQIHHGPVVERKVVVNRRSRVRQLIYTLNKSSYIKSQVHTKFLYLTR